MFDAGGDQAVRAVASAATKHVVLTEHNALAALYASAAIPAVMEGVARSAWRARGSTATAAWPTTLRARDDAADGLTLYPHSTGTSCRLVR